MIKSGLVSVTFRNKTPEEICELCSRTGLQSIAWGGDIHVPAGDIAQADHVRALSAGYRLEICAYGSYFRVGDDVSGFEACLDTAAALGAPLIRVWCGRKGSRDADDAERAYLVKELRRICEMAGRKGILVGLEFHGGTLTDDPASLKRLMDETADIPELRFYWQPRWDWDEHTRLGTLRQVLPRLAYIHTFTWLHTPDINRMPLDKGVGMWRKALRMAPEAYSLIEFVEGDSDAALEKDVAALHKWIREIG